MRSLYVDFRMAQASLTDSVSLIKEKASSGMLFPSATWMVYSSCSYLSGASSPPTLPLAVYVADGESLAICSLIVLPFMIHSISKKEPGYMSPDSHLRVGERQYPDHVLEVPLKPLKTVSTVATSTMTPPCARPPSHSRGALTAMATVTALRNALTSSLKRSTMHRASKRLLSQYLQSLKKAHPPLAATQSARSSPYLGGQGNLGPN